MLNTVFFELVSRSEGMYRVQWNHCLRTYCNKNFRGWIDGFNSFCQLIELGNRNARVPWNSIHWFLFPFNGYQYSKQWLLIYESKKQARQKHANRQGHMGSNPNTANKYEHNSLSLTLAGLTRGYLTSDAALGLCFVCLVLSCLWCPFSGPELKKLFGT